MSKAIIWMILRWIAVLPGSILFTLLIDFPIHWIIMMKSYNPDEPNLFGFITIPPGTLEYLAYALFNPIFVVLIAAYIAPSKKFAIAITMSILTVCLVTFSYFNTNLLDNMGFSGVCLRITLNIIGLAIALFIVYRKDQVKFVTMAKRTI